MKNRIFDIAFDQKCGGVSRLSFCNDPERMNFCKEGGALFALRDFALSSLCESESDATAVSSYQGVEARTEYAFSGEHLKVTLTLKNNNSYPTYYKNGDLILETPFCDAYEASDICMRARCHAHIHAGLEGSYIRCERMGVSEYHLGLLFTEGSFVSYRQERAGHCSRGYLAMEAEGFILPAGGERRLACTLFLHKGGEDFFLRARRIDGALLVESARGYSLFLSEPIEFAVRSHRAIGAAHCLVNGREAEVRLEGGLAHFSFLPEKTGEYEARFTVDGRRGIAVFQVLPDTDAQIGKRLHFIAEKQQCNDADSPLYGAYLVYDNEEGRQFFDYAFRDHNANRERMGMSLSIARWLQSHKDEALYESLMRFTDFLLRECVDEASGKCYGNIGKDESNLRLYNAPWVMLYFTELYRLTGGQRWIALVYRIICYYYGVGGAKFYPNGVRMHTVYRALLRAEMKKEAAEALAFFKSHAETICKNGILYPPHEVNFEQTIVTPALSILLDMFRITGEGKYLAEAEKHLRILEKFDGCQPHYRQNTVPIRYWDDYWFGKCGSYGDVFPHYWSVLSGYGYYLYYRATGRDRYLDRARRCMHACLANIREDGSATCSFLFPAWVSGTAQPYGKTVMGGFDARRGYFANAFANDQDFALYFLMKMEEDLKDR